MKRMYVAGSIVILPLALGCGGESAPGSSSAPPPGGTLTYFAETKPIFDAKCVSCHYTGGIAPFSMETYEDVAPYAGMIKTAVVAKTMPPWLAADGCAEYTSDRSLTAEQIDTISRWADGGAQKGDPSQEGAPIDTGMEPGLSRVDLRVSLPVDYTPQEQPDDYRCFVLDWPETETTYVTGFRATPGNAQVVHHVLAYVAVPGDQVEKALALDEAEAGPGYACFGGSGIGKAQMLGGWAPGGQGGDFPAGTGTRVEPGSKLILQMHYNTLTAGAQSDRTAIDLKLDKSIEKEGKSQFWTNPQWILNEMPIPANEPDVMHAWEGDPSALLAMSSPITLYSVNLHMHVLGERGRLAIRRADGTEECLLDIPRWNFHWQNHYGFQTPKTLNPGDKLYIECHWDNSPPNQPVVDGTPLVPKDVSWGEGTTDEMCLGAFYFTR